MTSVRNASHPSFLRTPRILVLAAVVTASLLWVAVGEVRGDFCVGSNPPFGSCHRKIRVYPGEFPFGVTVSEMESKVVVTDLFSGLFYKFAQSDISSEPQTEVLASPLGIASYTGLAYHSGDDLLYWLAYGSGGPELVRTSTAGSIIDSAPLVSPQGGVLAGLTYNAGTGSFWTGDIENDVYLELLADGTFTGTSFSSPGGTPFGGMVYGVGITAVFLQGLGDYVFDVPVGSPIDQRASRVVRVDTAGAEVGLFYDLDNSTALNGWVTGLAWADSGSTAGEVEFVADATSNVLVEVTATNPSPSTVMNLTCSVDATDTVTLSWMNPIPYTTIVVTRTGPMPTENFNLPGANTTFVDTTDLDSGTYRYEVLPIPPSGQELPAPGCELVAGFGRFVNAVPLEPGANALAITLVETTEMVYVADLTSGTTWRYTKDLTLIDSIASPFGTDVTAGLTWNPDTGSLFWYNATAGELQETDLGGSLIGPAAALASPLGGAVADIAYSAFSQTFWGVDISHRVCFEFLADGTATLATVPFPDTGGVPAGFGNGIAVVANDTSTVLDLPVGSEDAGLVTGVRRILSTGEDTGIAYDLLPSTQSAFVNGIVWTAAGSEGGPAEYIVGNDTGHIYEADLDLTALGDDYRRGDANGDGLTDITDATSILFYLFVAGTFLNCLDAADTNDDGALQLGDVTFLLEYLFQGGTTPPDPFGPCGPDPTTTDALTCDLYDSC